MSRLPIIKIHSCSEIVNNADYVDINYESADMFNIPKITVTTDQNVNAFLSNVTISTARINFSKAYTGTVKYTVMSTK
tara:strand:+ start:129 stop:362 length:234 start_codon:yes stop_codon:yes gene_type:complete